MTNTESRIAIELEGLALRDDAQAFDEAEQQMTEADVRELALYGFDSEQRTLVGLGPVERARRSRKAAEIPDSQRAPQSESPGPFIADDEAPAPLPRRKLGVWAVAAPSLLIVGTVAVLALRPRLERASSVRCEPTRSRCRRTARASSTARASRSPCARGAAAARRPRSTS